MDPFELKPSGATRGPGHALVLPVPVRSWLPPDTPVRVDGLVLAAKAELHLTLVGAALARELRAALGAPFLDDALRRALEARAWSCTRTGRLLLLRKRDQGGDGRPRMRAAIVERVDLPAMVPFQRALGRLLGRQLPVPPPHVTLYTAGADQGIGLPSPAMLRACTVRAVAAGELAAG